MWSPSVLAALLGAVLAAPPTGTYTGSTSILSETVDVSMRMDNATALDLNITGALTVSCRNEAYKFDDKASTITLLGLGKTGDCLHDTMAGLSIISVTYDSSADTIRVNGNYSFLPVKVSLTKPHRSPVRVGTARAEAHR